MDNGVIKCIINGTPVRIRLDSQGLTPNDYSNSIIDQRFFFTPTNPINKHFYIDMTGNADVKFTYGGVSIPVDSIQYYSQYENLPRVELLRYFDLLLERIDSYYSHNCILKFDLTKSAYTRQGAVPMLDICAIQQELLTSFWMKWKSCGYINENDALPLVLHLYGLYSPNPDTQSPKKKLF